MIAPTPKGIPNLDVVLRCGMKATIWFYPTNQLAHPFTLLGRTECQELHAWTRAGRWAYDQSDNPLDITHFFGHGGLKPFTEL